MDTHGEFLVTICTVVGAVLGAVIWMQGKFNKMDKRFNRIEKELVAIKTVMFVNGTPVPSSAMNDGDE